MNCSPPGSYVYGILQAKILEWVAIPPPGDLPNPGNEPRSLTSPIWHKGTTKDEMVGWHHQLDGPEFEQALGVSDGWTGRTGVLQSLGWQRVGYN